MVAKVLIVYFVCVVSVQLQTFREYWYRKGHQKKDENKKCLLTWLRSLGKMHGCLSMGDFTLLPQITKGRDRIAIPLLITHGT